MNNWGQFFNQTTTIIFILKESEWWSLIKAVNVRLCDFFKELRLYSVLNAFLLLTINLTFWPCFLDIVNWKLNTVSIQIQMQFNKLEKYTIAPLKYALVRVLNLSCPAVSLTSTGTGKSLSQIHNLIVTYLIWKWLVCNWAYESD